MCVCVRACSFSHSSICRISRAIITMGIVHSRYNNENAGNVGVSSPGSGIGVVGVSGMRDGLAIKGGQQQHQYCQPSVGTMGGGGGGGSLGGPHTRSGSIRCAPRQPMPDSGELERRFTKVLVGFVCVCPSVFDMVLSLGAPCPREKRITLDTALKRYYYGKMLFGDVSFTTETFLLVTDAFNCCKPKGSSL